jgi:hypothetical protein
MPIKTITVPQDFLNAMNQFTAQMKNLLAGVDKVLKQSQFQAQVQQSVNQVQQTQNRVSSQFGRLDQLFGKMGTMISANVERLLQVLPSAFRKMTAAITSERIEAVLGDVSMITRFAAMGRMAGIAGAGGPIGLILAAGYVSYRVIKFFIDLVKRIANDLHSDFQLSLQTGLSISEIRAMRIGFIGLPQDALFFQQMSRIRGAFPSREAVVLHNVLGIRNSDDDTLDAMVKATLAAAKFMKAQDLRVALTRAEAFGLTKIWSPQTLLAMRNMSQVELEREAAWTWAHRHSFTPDHGAVENLETFRIRWGRFTDNWQNYLLNKMEQWGILKKLNDWSANIADWIKQADEAAQYYKPWVVLYTSPLSMYLYVEYEDKLKQRGVSSIWEAWKQEFEAVFDMMRHWTHKINKLADNIQRTNFDFETGSWVMAHGFFGRRGLSERLGIDIPGLAGGRGLAGRGGRAGLGRRLGMGGGSYGGGYVEGAGGISPGTGGLPKQGAVNSSDLYNLLKQKFANSKLNGYVPADGARWGITTGSPDEWARLALATAKQESSLNSFEAKGGLFQMNPQDLHNYGVYGDWRDPNVQAQGAVNEWEKHIRQDGVVSKRIGGRWLGAGRYFESLREEHAGGVADVDKYLNKGGWADKASRVARGEAVPDDIPTEAGGDVGTISEGSGRVRGDGRGRIGGEINIGGRLYHFGSGGAPGHPHIPYGDYPVTPGTVGAWGAAHGALGINNNRIWDPTLHRYREGIEFHAGSSLNSITQGCIAIAGPEWQSAKMQILRMIREHGHAYVHIGPNGASITPDPHASGKVEPLAGSSGWKTFGVQPWGGGGDPLRLPSTNTPTDSSSAPSGSGGRLLGSAAGVDPRLVDSVRKATWALPPGWHAEITSGVRARGSRSSQHFSGHAMDIQIYDAQGRPVPNSGPDATGQYTRLARATYGQILSLHPELKGKFAWGGAFGTELGGGGPPDLMHFDIGGERGRWDARHPSAMGPLYPMEVEKQAAPPEPWQSYGTGPWPSEEEDDHPANHLKVENSSSFDVKLEKGREALYARDEHNRAVLGVDGRRKADVLHRMYWWGQPEKGWPEWSEKQLKERSKQDPDDQWMTHGRNWKGQPFAPWSGQQMGTKEYTPEMKEEAERGKIWQGPPHGDPNKAKAKPANSDDKAEVKHTGEKTPDEKLKEVHGTAL